MNNGFGPRRRASHAFAALLLFCGLAIVHTWPLASAPATLSRNDNKDTVLNTWAITWIARALTTAPSTVLDGNIFHPERHTIAFSEPVVVPGLLSVPVRAGGAGPVLTYNISLLVGYALSAWAMQWLAWRWTGSYGASLVAGSLYAFNAHSLVSMGHIQAIHAYGLPLLLVGLDGLLSPERRAWHGLLAGAATALLALTSGYLAIFGIACALVMLLVRPRALLQPPWRPLVAGSVAGVLLLGVLVFPVIRAYVDVRASHGFARSLEDVAQMSANGSAYLATPSRMHAAWARDVYATMAPRDSLFPGVMATALALVGLALWPGRVGDARLRTAAAVTLAGLVLSFGPATPIYSAWHGWVPFASGIRAASRFGVLWLTGLSILAAFGVAAIGRRRPRIALAASAAALLAVNVEAFRGPVPFVPAQPISPVYDALAAQPDGIVAEMPFWWLPTDVPRNADYMLASTRHWKPLLNGYSGFTPASYRQRADVLWYFPFRPASFDELDRADVRYVVLHLGEYGSQRQEALDAIAASGRLRLVTRDGETLLYAVVR